MMDVYEILEKVISMQQAVARIEDKVNRMAEQQAVHAHVLAEHHKRSTMLEEAMNPVRTHVSLVQKGLYAFGGIFLAVMTQYAIKKFIG